ncbi:MAG TPA: stage III sporulation protein AF [Bacillota bacterium]|nr:stage III sporulation protein AF [Bacillota bacterium]
MGLTQITEWLKQIIAAVFLAGFLEMLLPNNELKGATRMIMGLLIMMILIQPLVKIFKMPTELLWSMPETIIGTEPRRVLPSANDLIKQGKRIREQWASAQTPDLAQDPHVTLENKLRTMIAMIDEVTLRELTPVYRDGELTGVKLKVAAAKAKISDPQLKKTVERRLYQSVALFSNLPQSRIEVLWDGRAGARL